MIFCNERGELTEGTRSNIFLRRGGALLTPALACGLLDGCLRAELIAQGDCTEAVLTEADLETPRRSLFRQFAPRLDSRPAPLDLGRQQRIERDAFRHHPAADFRQTVLLCIQRRTPRISSRPGWRTPPVFAKSRPGSVRLAAAPSRAAGSRSTIWFSRSS